MAKTADRLRYEAVQRNQATMRRVNELLNKESSKILSLGEGMAQQELGGFYRSVVPGLVDRWGNVNAAAAIEYYDSQRLAWQLSKGGGEAAERFAQRQLQAQIYVAKLPPIDPKKISEPIIGHGMQTFLDKGFGQSQTAVQNALTRAVASYNRDTILYNSALDSAVVRVQRIAEPTACGFCVQMALFSTDYMPAGGGMSNISQVNYAADFHNNCQCSIETIYEGDDFLRPDYYDQFDKAVGEYSGYTSTPQDVAADLRKARSTGDLPANLANL